MHGLIPYPVVTPLSHREWARVRGIKRTTLPGAKSSVFSALD